MAKLIFNVALFAVAIVWGRRAPVSFLRALGILIIAVLCAGLVAAVTGWMRYAPPGQPAPSEVHRWTAHGGMIFAWLLVCAGVGGALGYGSKYNRWLATLSGYARYLHLGSGYWKPSLGTCRQTIQLNGERWAKRRTTDFSSFISGCCPCSWGP